MKEINEICESCKAEVQLSFVNLLLSASKKKNLLVPAQWRNKFCDAEGKNREKKTSGVKIFVA